MSRAGVVLRRVRGSRGSAVAATALVVTALVGVALYVRPDPVVRYVDQTSSVWIVKSGTSGGARRVNARIHQVDGRPAVAGTVRDVVQVGPSALVALEGDSGSTSFLAVDLATMTVGDEVNAPGRVVVAGGDQVVSVDPDSGGVWLRRTESGDRSGTVEFEGRKAFSVGKVGPDEVGALVQRVAVGPDGTVAAFHQRRSTMFVVRPTPAGAAPVVEQFGVPDLSGLAADVSVAGGRAMVLDRTSGRLWVEGRGWSDPPTAEVTPGASRLQVPGDDTTAVVVAAGGALFRWTARSGFEPLTESGAAGSGAAAPETVVRPAVDPAGCAHGAWLGARVVVACPGREPVAAPLDDGFGPAGFGRSARFRTGGDFPVLSSPDSGNSLQVLDGTVHRIPWTEKAVTDDGRTRVVEPIDPSRENRFDPEPEKDALAVRAGRVNRLPVLVNDRDRDRDVLTVSRVEGSAVEQFGVRVSSDLRSLEVDLSGVSGDAVDSFSLSYEVSDGRGKTALGNADVRVIGAADPGAAPLVVPDPLPLSVDLAADETVNLSVLGQWFDPDGDAMFVSSATSDDPADRVTWDPGGKVTLRAGPGARRTSVMTVAVSDETGRPGPPVQVAVRKGVAAGAGAVVANDDFVYGTVGRPLEVRPLANDRAAGSSAGALRVVRFEPVTPSAPPASVDEQSGRVQLAGGRDLSEEGTFVYLYEAAAGGKPATGLVRVEVRPANAPPVANTDVVLVPSNGTASVDMVANDVDPAGQVLGVNELLLSESTRQEEFRRLGATVYVSGGHMLRVADDGTTAPPGSTSLQYRVTNGRGEGSAVGRVVLVRTNPGACPDPEARRLVVAPDLVKVRPGDVVSVPVLANDRTCNGSGVILAPELTAADGGPAPDTAWVDGSLVRFRAPDVAPPAPVELTYTAVTTGTGVGTFDQTGSVTVLVSDDVANVPPKPLDLAGRVVAGRSAVLAVPLDVGADGGLVDPDGDSVELVGPSSTPRLGTAEISEDGRSLTYLSSDSSALGPDTFRYQVRDRSSASATAEATANVVVMPRVRRPASGSVAPQDGSAPVGVPDLFLVPPGSDPLLPVLANDGDSDGDPLSVAASSLVGPAAEQLKAKVVEGTAGAPDRVKVEVPDDCKGATKYVAVDGEHCWWSFSYRVEDGSGALPSELAQVRVETSPVAKGLPPVARDDRAVIPEGREQVAVPVLTNDDDPDGLVAELALEVVAGEATVDGQKLVVRRQSAGRSVQYRITDRATGQRSSAVVWVPGPEDDQLPRLVKGAKPVEFKVGAPATRDLKALGVVEDPDGDEWVVDPSVGFPPELQGSASGTSVTLNPAESATGELSLVVPVRQTRRGGAQLVTPVAVPVKVVAKDNTPPRATGAASFNLYPGRNPRSYSLADYFDDVDPGDKAKLRFAALGGCGSGISCSVGGGGELQLLAEGAEPGASSSFQVQAEDPANGKSEPPLQVTVSVVDAPEVVVVQQATDRMANTGPKTFDVSQYVSVQTTEAGVQPTDWTLTGARASGGATVADNGKSLTVTPAATTVGNVTVTYEVKTKGGRTGTGSLSLSVFGKPTAPGTPTLASGAQEDGRVSLQWAASDFNDGADPSYSVTASPGGARCSPGNSTTCTISGLANGTAYTFTVVATNEAGESPKATSAPITPDTLPSQPVITSVESDAAGSLTVSWTVANKGSALRQILLAGAASVELGGSATSRAVTGLTDGVESCFTVVAVNGAEQNGGRSEPSAQKCGTPWGPAQASDVRASYDQTSKSVTVSWGVDRKGTPSNEDLTAKVDGPCAQGGGATVAAAAGSAVLSGCEQGFGIVFTVTVSNRRGTLGGVTASTDVVDAPGPPGPPVATLAGAGQVRVTAAPPADTGGGRPQVQYALGSSGPWRTNSLWAGLTAWSEVQFWARACNDDACSDPVGPSDPVTPYGAPSPPNAMLPTDCDADTGLCAWSAPRGSVPAGESLVAQGAESSSTGGDPLTGTVAAGKSVRICLAQYSGVCSAAVRAPQPPDPPVEPPVDPPPPAGLRAVRARFLGMASIGPVLPQLTGGRRVAAVRPRRDVRPTASAVRTNDPRRGPRP